MRKGRFSDEQTIAILNRRLEAVVAELTLDKKALEHIVSKLS